MSLYETFYNKAVSDDKPVSITKEERRAIMEAIKNFSRYGDVIYRGSKIKETVNEIASLVEAAKTLALQETAEWFDDVTVNRHAKQIDEALKVLRTESVEISKRQQRLESAFEDLAQNLGKYYEV